MKPQSILVAFERESDILEKLRLFDAMDSDEKRAAVYALPLAARFRMLHAEHSRLELLAKEQGAFSYEDQRRLIAIRGAINGVWLSLSPIDKELVRDNSDLSPQLRGLEGWRVEVFDEMPENPHAGREAFESASRPRRFIVGKSNGWRPCHLEISRRNSCGGDQARKHYARVSKLYEVR